MKTLIGICLLSLSALATAQTSPNAAPANREAEEARLRSELDRARAELDRKVQEVAELSMKLSGSNGFVLRTGGPHRAMLGVQIDGDADGAGARVSGVSPGGPAEEAGLRAGDVIVALDGKSIAGERAGRALVEQMQGVKPEQKVKVRVLRAGKNKDFVVIARPLFGFGPDRRIMDLPPPGSVAVGVGGPMEGGFPFIRHFRHSLHNEFNGLELASLTPKLGTYFGAAEGVLVVSAPQSGALKLEDGDVIQAIDGRKPADGAHALRILRSYKSGEKLSLSVLRQRKPLTLAVTMPDRPDPAEDFFMPAPMSMPTPAAPPAPPAPVAPAGPGGVATFD